MAGMQGLTKRQAQTLDFIRQSIEERGYPPTLREIGESMGIRSTNGVNDHLRALERKGYLRREDMKSRALRLVSQEPEAAAAGADESAIDVQVVGRVAAGSPILAEQHIETRYLLDPALFDPRADYLLRVRGMSMRDAGILDGDLLAVHRTREARSGQIVVARINDDVTVKRLRRQGSLVRLLPENPEFKPIHVNPQRDTLVIEGVGVGVIRNGKPL